MKNRTALILCAGLGQRLRPLTHSRPKTLVPFLNLPLLCYNWFLLEEMGVSSFLLNSHLFPKILKKLTEEIKKPQQKIRIFHENPSLGAAGTLQRLKTPLQKEKNFLYLNGDSLLFPSKKEHLKNFLQEGEKDTLPKIKPPPMALFYTAPLKEKELQRGGALWVDENNTVRAIGGKEIKEKGGRLRPLKFSGLALFNQGIFKYLKKHSSHIFEDVIIPLLLKEQFKVFIDEKALIFEGGEIPSYLSATEKALRALFSKENSFLKNHLKEVFFRFDPEDRFIGLKRGRRLHSRLKMPLLCPEDVKGLDFVSGEGFAVIGKGVQFSGKSFLKNSVLGPSLNWRGSLKEKLLFAPPITTL